MKNAEINADRFMGFADVYYNARPTLLAHFMELIRLYLGRDIGTVVDLGCGTGLSTDAWKGNCGKVIGIEPSGDMLAVARQKSGHLANIRNSGHFRYVRELVFANAAPYTTQRFIGLAQSQGSLQTLLKLHPELIESDWKRFQERISECFGEPRIVEFCYRVRLGVK